MRVLVPIAAICAAACGDNELGAGPPLEAAHDLVVVAHQDDDLLFMQPDVVEAVQRGTGVVNVYVTAGNGTKGTEAADKRYVGLREAYGEAAGDHAWDCGWITIRDHVAQHCRLAAENVSLVFLAYPDGGKEGEQPTSLLKLWRGEIANATTIADRTTTYDRDELIETVAEIIRTVQPSTLRTLEIASTHGHDHADHMVVGALAMLAAARATSHAELVAYRGYNTAEEQDNKLPASYAALRAILGHYEACATGCGECGTSCATIDPTHETWLHRRYAVGFRKAARGALRSGDACVLADASLGACDAAPTWALDADGELRGASGCLGVAASGDVVASDCLGGPERRWFIDDEDHVWSALPPESSSVADLAHARCLVPSATGVRADACGDGLAPAWSFAPQFVATDRASFGITGTGRAVRLADISGDGRADLCTVEPGGLYCARGDGTGGFGAAVHIDLDAPLAIDPLSLAIGDVDGDGIGDACGRDASGVLCALSIKTYQVARFTPQFNDNDARLGTSASLAAIDSNGDGVADICGLAAPGVVCSQGGAMAMLVVRSAWPAPEALVWPADFDGDHIADWCSTSPTGPACGVDAESALSRDGVPWAFSLHGVVEDVPADPAITATGDIDGDGDIDLCVLDGSRIACARSQGRGFGPRSTIARLPDGVTATALWLGDLDGDGVADACVDTGTQILCARL